MSNLSAHPTWQETILESIADGVFTVNLDWKITYFNRAAEHITGISRKDAIGRHCWEVFRANVCESGCFLRRTLETNKPSVHNTAYIIGEDGTCIPISISTAVLRDEKKEVCGGVESFHSLAEMEQLRKELTKHYTFGDIVSKNKQTLELLDILPQIALSNASVLIEGESGTGKELFACAIHNLSSRRDNALVVVNCAALPDSLLESELFGHVAGAFTGAKHERAGRFQLADKGTIFLDEIGDISPAMQVRLLRVLQEKTFEPLGSDKTVHIDVRVLAATNKHLSELVEQGRFRADLFYRLNVVNLTILPLRHRREDIPLLVDHFINQCNHLQGKNISHISPEALRIIMNYPFPGNVRELQNAIEHAFVLCTGEVLLPEHLPKHLQDAQSTRQVTLTPAGTSMDKVEVRLIEETLRQCDFNRSACADKLGIHKTTLWRKMKKFGIQVPKKSNS